MDCRVKPGNDEREGCSLGLHCQQTHIGLVLLGPPLARRNALNVAPRGQSAAGENFMKRAKKKVAKKSVVKKQTVKAKAKQTAKSSVKKSAVSRKSAQPGQARSDGTVTWNF